MVKVEEKILDVDEVEVMVIEVMGIVVVEVGEMEVEMNVLVVVVVVVEVMVVVAVVAVNFRPHGSTTLQKKQGVTSDRSLPIPKPVFLQSNNSQVHVTQQ
ncbi:hypothetical protein PoB_002433100 [Plakobranchus ocellatus]|uniref:Uncharacterized protein n=1 Tax=Plakobranchus ocellatus TaxID=259542 RepID=A0AAV3ZTH3_9GAST|nr:hypothetical protein PoB_002433100 [Plakobranchus ocellatus]